MRYIRDNNTYGLKYYSNKNHAPVSDILIKYSVKTDNQLKYFSDSSWQDFLDTGRSTGSVAYIIFYQVGSIDHGTHVPVPVAQSITESDYNASCTVGMALAHFRILILELMNKDPDIVPEEAPLIYWIVILMCVWIRMVRIPNTHFILQVKCIFKGMVKIAR